MKSLLRLRSFSLLIIVSGLHFASLSAQPQEKHPFILFNDGTMLAEEAMLDSLSPIGGWTLRLRGGRRVPVLHVHSFQNTKGRYYRIFDRSVVTQKESDGRISLYRRIENDLLEEVSPQPNPFGVSKYFSKDDAQVLPIKYDNIYNAVQDNETSRSYLHQYEYLNYLKYTAVVVTAGCIAYDLPRYRGPAESPTASLASGAVTIVIGTASYFLQSYLLEQSVAVYNN